MRTEETILRVLRPLEESIHAARIKCLGRVIAAIFVASRLSLTQVGRALGGSMKPKHAIKRVDVLLGNHHLVGDAEIVQRYFASLVPGERRPVLLVDWTDIGKHWTALVVTLVTAGRGVTLCWEVDSQTRKNSPRIESRILKRVAALLPPDSVPILVTDAGFRGRWMKKVRALGWDFVSRIRGRVRLRPKSGRDPWRPVKQLWAQAARQPSDRGEWELAQYDPVEARVVTLWRKRRKASAALPRVGRRKKRSIKSAREPWILATSLAEASPQAIVELYELRMRIELTFRDQKCSRFGFGLDDVRTRKVARVRAYMLLAALAHYVALMVGAAIEKAGLASRFQANTVTSRRVLSWARLGRETLRWVASPLLNQIPQTLHFPMTAAL